MSTQQDPAWERARLRARRLREFYGHLGIYVAVCLGLVVIDLATGSAGSTFIGLNWAFWPILGWGLAVAIHGISVAMPFSGKDWEDRKTDELYEKERQRQLTRR